MTDEKRTARLEALVAAFGPDISRWPAAGRRCVTTPAELDALAGIGEARALDRLLDEAARREPAPVSGALIETIRAQAGPRRADAAIQPVEVARTYTGPRNRRATPLYRAPAAAAALMAASLAVGLFIGSLTATQTTVAQIGTLAGLELGTTAGTATFEDDFFATEEEDIL
jgi:hypothetical protein